MQKITKLPCSPKNAGESEDDYTPIWGDSYEAYKDYQEHNPQNWADSSISELFDNDINLSDDMWPYSFIE